ncbi:MAG: hypothetical protein ACRYFS_03695, partial [Janthinobacterium lividum]
SGGTVTTYPVAAGVVSTRIPWHLYSQAFTLSRNGVNLCSCIEGRQIIPNPLAYNFSLQSGYAVAQ